MKKIDRETVQKILDTADIVEVVSDFVHLKKRGANYVGLCPFHNERTPSFSVSRSRGICKCFSCGKGGSPVNFLMELEQMSYYEALRYLANKYNIQIKEHDMTDEERQLADERESMFAVNDFAMRFFESTMRDTVAGRNVGRAYFNERGINDAMVNRFHLGYSPEGRSELHDAAVGKGFNEKFLLSTGLCYATERGGIVDRFRGRVIYPVQTVSGKVIAFGGRTLRKDKDVAKYVNSPESLIYKKSSELYGLYQAKQAIVRKDKCILVEGYMDVISMHQSGVENVVASSGTSLTEGQIRLIHRFTENVTVIYDSDAAGIKASLRGIDMLLAEGMNVKVLLLPDGDDPDSFAQSHSSSEVEEYLVSHETDFIAFKTRILMEGVGSDPLERSRAIQSIVRSISVIPDAITRTVYIGEYSRELKIDEQVLTLQVAKYAAERAEVVARDKARERNRELAGLRRDEGAQPATITAAGDVAVSPDPPARASQEENLRGKFLLPYEVELVKYVVRYGMVVFCEAVNDDDTTRPMCVLEYVDQSLAAEGIVLANEGPRRVMERVKRLVADEWTDAWGDFSAGLENELRKMRSEGVERIRGEAADMSAIAAMEKQLEESVEARRLELERDFCSAFLLKRLVSDDDDAVRLLSTELATPKHHLSRIHTKYTHIDSELERLPELVPHAIYNLKGALIECEINEVKQQIKDAYKAGDAASLDKVVELMKRSTELNHLKMELSKYLGERVLSPRRKL